MGCFCEFKFHDDVIKWKHFPRYWPFVRGIPRSSGNSPRKGQWCGALMFSLICAWINGWVNNYEAGDFRRHRAHYDVIVMSDLSSHCAITVYVQILFDCVIMVPYYIIKPIYIWLGLGDLYLRYIYVYVYIYIYLRLKHTIQTRHC